MKTKRLLATLLCTLMLLSMMPAQSAIVLADGANPTSAYSNPVESTGTPADPTDPTDPTNPKKATKPTNPTSPTNPTAPTDATGATDPTETTESTETTEPSVTTESADPTVVQTAEQTETPVTQDPVTPPQSGATTEPAATTEETKETKEPTKDDPTEPKTSETESPTTDAPTTDGTTTTTEEPTSEEPTSEDPATDEPTETEEISVRITVTPAVANYGETVTLTANVSGPAGMAYQWQWAPISHSDAERLADAGDRGSASASGVKNELQAQDGRIWRDESGANSLVHSFEASEDTLNRYWRLKVWVPEEKTAGETGLSSLRDFFFSSAIAEGGDYVYSDGLGVVYNTFGTMSVLTGLTITPKNVEVNVGSKSTLTLTKTPSNADFDVKTATWVSSDDSKATVVAGVVTGVAPGTVTITASGAGVDSEPITVTVKEVGATRIALASGSETTLNVGQYIVWNTVFTPSNTTNKNLKITVTQNGNYVTVPASSTDGTISILAEKAGTATIRVEYAADSKLYFQQTVTVKQAVTGVDFESHADKVAVGKTLTLKPIITPNDARTKTLTWSSSDTSKATVSSSGVVTGVSASEVDEVVITATPVDAMDASVKAEAYLTIVPQVLRVIIKESGEQVNEKTLGLDIGDSLMLDFENYPSGAKQDVEWTSSNARVASVDLKSGLVTALTKGTVTITAKATDGSNKTATVKVNVSAMPDLISISGENTVASGRTTRLTAVATKGGSTTGVTQTFTWESSNPNIATVSAGTVTGQPVSRETDVTIKAIATDGSGVFGTFVIKVMPITTSLTILKDGETITTLALDLGSGTAANVVAYIQPSTAKQDIEWTTTSKSIATIMTDPTGVNASIKPVGVGTATITAKTTDGSNRSATLRVTVSTLGNEIQIKDANGNIVGDSGGPIGQVSVAAGKTAKLTATVLPATASNKNVTWKSLNEESATVSSSGVVTAKNVTKNSTATIVAETADGSKIQASATIVITPAATRVTVWDDTDTMITKLAMEYGQKTKLTVKIEPEDANQEVTWRTSNATVAEIDADGNVEAGYRSGTATLTATAKDGSGRTATVTVTVAQFVEDISVFYNGEEINDGTTLNVAAGKSIKLTASGTPSTATNTRVTWESTNTNVATVSSSGQITARNVEKNATADIIIKAADGSEISKTITIEVTPAATKIVLYDNGVLATDISVDETDKGQTRELTAVITPSDASQAVTWKSSNVNVARVDYVEGSSDVTITIGTKGTATITATTTDGTNRSATIRFTVTKLAEQVIIKENGVAKDEAQVAIGKTIRLTADVLPTTTVNKNVTWSSSDTAIATVSTAGVVTGKKEGTVTITAKAADGSEVASDSIIVQVMPVATRVAIKDTVTGNYISSYMVDLGVSAGSVNFAAEVWPLTAGQNVTWKSSSTAVAEVEQQDDGSVVVYPIRAGTATITATATDGSGKYTTLTLTVGYLPSGIAINSDGNVYYDDSVAGNAVAGGKSVRFTAAITPTNATKKDVTWEVKVNPSGVATISTAGVLTTKKVDGVVEATIVATSKDNPDVTAEFQLYIMPATSKITFTDEGGTTMTSTTIDFAGDKTKKIYANVTPAAASKSITWKTSSTAYVKIIDEGIDANGAFCVLEGVKVGSARITATTEDGTRVSANLDVKVAVLVNGITIDDTYSDTMRVGEVQTLKAIVEPADLLSSKDIKWISEDPTIASVNSVSGLVTARKAGVATIKAIPKDASSDFEASVTITVLNKVSGITIKETAGGSSVNNKNYALKIGDTQDFVVTEANNGPDITSEVTWSTGNKAIATVNDGNVAATGVGTTFITATYKVNSSTFTARVQITVSEDSGVPDPETPAVPKSVKITGDGISGGQISSLAKGDTLTLTATAFDADGKVADGTTFTWASSTSYIVSVTPDKNDSSKAEIKVLVDPRENEQFDVTITAESKPGYYRDKVKVIIQ